MIRGALLWLLCAIFVVLVCSCVKVLIGGDPFVDRQVVWNLLFFFMAGAIFCGRFA